ncbi:threonine-phosphate decarboxylase [Jannaschia pagri]|uniref:Aminotransferase n=1 Tax=Jannaschia pagri TaxID=2829797 RepID=A0ABQ4NIM0_9RHOB|nr:MULTISPECIES: threonine-phosphate decarboxylase [unclassified Jannaschia]GIT89828.1 threonine-phosphate decarboxylase [Jannaschia sp. AI_61]GIT94065.1 threonine-phosphate decarboxylase [Jannaschia sp. AI_62]
MAAQGAPLTRDHGGGLDAARAQWGGDDWLDLSTGINPHAYPIPHLPPTAWTALPDTGAETALIRAARSFWHVPEGTGVLAAPGASALIAALPRLAPGRRVVIPHPTYNEHAAAFAANGFEVVADGDEDALVIVHPNNPDGRLWPDRQAPFTVIDESFCDVCPDASRVAEASRPGFIVLKSFGKFWGLAGLRLGFAIAHPDTLAPLAEALGPWPVSGPALGIGATALGDTAWAMETRARLRADAKRLDGLMERHGDLVGGTDLFRLYDVGDAGAMQDRLARHQIWSRIFPYSGSWLRLGLPPTTDWTRLEQALT